MTNYVYQGEEVYSTGRVAKRNMQSKLKSIEGTTEPPLLEITPVNKINGDWSKWVSLVELYEITEISTE